MRHRASPEFWGLFERLPEEVRRLARKNHEQLKSDPAHPSLQLKRVGRYWSVRVGLRYRALGVDVEDGVIWFWIGTHAAYDGLLRRMV